MSSSCNKKLKVDTALRGIAGLVLLFSLVMTKFHSENWYWFSVFIGLNLLQSSITNWCPMMTILRKGCKLEN